MYSLLIVDDEDEIRNALSQFYPWGELGFVVTAQASSLAEAEAAVEEFKPDAVLSDIRMADGTGLDLAAFLQERYPRTKVVLLSAYRKFEYAQEALRYGVRSYLVKPPVYDELCALFRAVAAELTAERDAETDKSVDSIVDTVNAYVRGNLRNANLEAAARTVGMSPGYLSTLFHERTGECFGALVLRTRMTIAAKLLAGRRVSVEAVSKDVGYSSPKNFTRAFKQFYGNTPRAYRRGIDPSDASASTSAAGTDKMSGNRSTTTVPTPAPLEIV